jgi:hypothetical protein
MKIEWPGKDKRLTSQCKKEVVKKTNLAIEPAGWF